MSGSWKVTLPCTRAEAEAIDAESLADVVLMTTEEVEDNRERWRLDAYVEAEPDATLIAALRDLVPSAWEAAPVVERLAAEDWVTLSQAGLEPIQEGRILVHTGAHQPPAPRLGRMDLWIEAGRAFGTGHHATTSGCLRMLDQLECEALMFERIIDVGTGSGLLAIAAKKLWNTDVVGTDIDPAAVAVARENAAANRVESVEWVVADGALSDTIIARAPYDLIIANVLAGPLISMAPELAAIAAPEATIVLAGLLETQRADVVGAYEACGCSVVEADRRDDWTILRLATAASRFVPASPPDPKGRDGWALDL